MAEQDKEKKKLKIVFELRKKFNRIYVKNREDEFTKEEINKLLTMAEESCGFDGGCKCVECNRIYATDDQDKSQGRCNKCHKESSYFSWNFNPFMDYRFKKFK